MEEIFNLLENLTIAEKRSCLYYLGRYIKQADSFENYQKDIFEDDIESEPSEEVKNITLNLILVIENIAGKKASDFSEDEFIFWMNKIAEIEDNIDPQPSDEQIKNAIKNLDGFKIPKINDL
jgi:hypothetical protein